MYSKIYVPVDNSAHSNRAIDAAIQVGKAFSAELVGCHVYAAKMHDYRFKQMEYSLPEEYLEENELERQRKIHDSLITMGLQLISDSYLDGILADVAPTLLQLMGIEPPAEIVANAGLEAAYAHLDVDFPRVPPTPILGMTLPPPPAPQPIHDTFEGGGPATRQLHGANEHALLEITDETAFAGTHCLKITDSPQAVKPFYPMVIYGPGFETGSVTVSFAIRPGPGASITIEGRDYTTSKPFTSGPVLRVMTDGRLMAGDKEIARLVPGEWTEIELKFTVGDGRPDTYSAKVSPAGGEAALHEGLPLASESFKRFDWFAFTGSAAHDCVVYIDEVRISYE